MVGDEALPTNASFPVKGVKRPSRANIGRSISIKGELRGQEDLSIDGTVEGAIDLHEQNLIIEQNARVKARIHAKNVVILGEVKGVINALERVEVHAIANVQGEVSSSEVVIKVARFPLWILLLLLLPPTLFNLWAWSGLKSLSQANRQLLGHVDHMIQKNGEDLAKIRLRLLEHQEKIVSLGQHPSAHSEAQGGGQLAFDSRARATPRLPAGTR